jgi:ParB family chromosome partitioning protein
MSQTITKKKNSLGKGLGALLSNDLAEKKESTGGNGIYFIPVSQIEANPFQPRTAFEKVQLEELSSSIAVHGLVQPITVRKIADNKYQLISGERRTRASIMAGLDSIPAYVRMANDQEMLEMALIENIQRADLNAIEIGLSYKRLLEECNLKQEELGARVGKNRTTVNNYMRLLKLPDQIQLGIISGSISMGHARAIINVDDVAKQLEFYEQIVENNLSVRDIESMVKRDRKEDQAEKVAVMGTDWDPEIDKITEDFTKALGTPVHLKTTARGAGKIIISYKNRDELAKILKIVS